MDVGNSSSYGFYDSMPEGDDGMAYEIRRVPTSGKIRGVILSDNLTCRKTHWWGNRTVPHLDVDCKPCAENVEGRWHGWVALHNVDRATTIILELTAKSIKPFKVWFDDFKTLRGAQVELGRVGKNANGRVFSTLSRGPVASHLLPPCPDVPLLLLKMWGIEPTAGLLGIRLPRFHESPANGSAHR